MSRTNWCSKQMSFLSALLFIANEHFKAGKIHDTSFCIMLLGNSLHYKESVIQLIESTYCDQAGVPASRRHGKPPSRWLQTSISARRQKAMPARRRHSKLDSDAMASAHTQLHTITAKRWHPNSPRHSTRNHPVLNPYNNRNPPVSNYG